MNGRHPSLGRLDSMTEGTVSTPGEAGFEEAARAWNVAAEQRPLAVVNAASASDVVATVNVAREEGVRIAPQATGHGAAAIVGLEEAILLRTDELNAVEVDPDRRLARVQAGARSGPVASAAGGLGLAALHGSSPTVAMAGYTLGGGHGWLARSHGLACNSVAWMQVVTADGQLREVGPESDPDLFWALRGGGGSFGIVTEIGLELVPVAEAYAGCLMLPVEHGPELFALFAEWTRSVPEQMNAAARYLSLPPLPQIPEPLRGRRVVDLTAAFTGDDREGAELIEPFRKLGEPIMDTFGRLPASKLCELNRDPEDPIPGVTDGAPLTDLDADALGRIEEVAGPESGSPAVAFQVRHLGGALSREPAGAGALAKLPGNYMYADACALMGPPREAIESHLSQVRDALSPWACEHRFYNFADGPHDCSELLPASTYRSLCEVKERYDPGDLILAAHQVPAGQAAPRPV